MSRSVQSPVCILGLLLFFGSGAVVAQTEKITDQWQTPEARQFDFWIGEWDVNLRMIQKDLTWKDSVKAKTKIYPILDGKAILELWDSQSIKGFSLRYYDPDKKKWVLYLNWPSNSRSSISSLEGSFRHGRGEFYSTNKQADGKESISRYTFCDIADNSLRWDDAYSQDGGKTWTNNWVMEFSRTAQMPSWPTSGQAHTFDTGNRCQGPEFDLVNSLAGSWSGKLELKNASPPTTVEATINAYRILDGCTVIRFLEFRNNDTTYRSFGLISYNKQTGQFEQLRMDNKPESKAFILQGTSDENQILFSADKELDGEPIKLKHQWTFPTSEQPDLQIATTKSTDDGKTWSPMFSGSFSRSADWQNQSDSETAKSNTNLGEESGSAIADGIYLVQRWTDTKPDIFPLQTDERYFLYDENKFFQLQDEQPEPVRHIGLSKTEFIPFQLTSKPGSVRQPDGRLQIGLEFSPDMQTRLTDFSRDYLGRQVAMVIGGEIVTLHKVRSVIKTDGIKISRCTDDGCQLILSKFAER